MTHFNDLSLTKKDAQNILDLEENWLMDKKGKDITPGKLSHTVSAFANANGGEIYVGISHDDDKAIYYWDGFPTKEHYNQMIDIITEICPGYDDCSFDFCYCEDYDTVILHIIIQKTRQVVFATDHKPYLRIGVQNIPQNTPEKLRQLEYDKGIFSYEDENTNYTYDDIKDSSVLQQFMQYCVPLTSAKDWLKSQVLMTKDLSKRINVAGVLLYSEIPQAVLPKHSGIRILRYHTDLKEGTRETLDDGFPISIEGDIYHLISQAVQTTIRIIEESYVVGQSGMESKKYPEVTLHEIIANAVLHRDYSIAADIQIRIFTNRIEVESPGKLPGHITTENILREYLSRNGKIVRLISKFPSPPNKDAGEGLNSAFDAMVKMNLKKPVIIEKDNSVLVVIKHERLADHETTVLDYLKDHESINNSEGREITGINDKIEMKDVFARLRKQGALEMVPGKKGNATRLTNYEYSNTEISQFSIDKSSQLEGQLKLNDI